MYRIHLFTTPFDVFYVIFVMLLTLLFSVLRCTFVLNFLRNSHSINLQRGLFQSYDTQTQNAFFSSFIFFPLFFVFLFFQFEGDGYLLLQSIAGYIRKQWNSDFYANYERFIFCELYIIFLNKSLIYWTHHFNNNVLSEKQLVCFEKKARRFFWGGMTKHTLLPSLT